MNPDLQLLEVASSTIPSSAVVSVEQVCQTSYPYSVTSSDESIYLMQEQVSSPYLPFSLDEYLDEESILISQDTPPTIPNHVKAQLQRVINHLELDISILVQDAGSIKRSSTRSKMIFFILCKK
jgi:hypothetical protein